MTHEEKIKVLHRAIEDRIKATKELREKISVWESEIIEMQEELNELQSEALFYNLKGHLTAIKNFCKVAKCANCPFNAGTGKCYLTLHAPLFWEIK